MISFIRRHAATLAILAVTGLAAPTSVMAQQDAPKAAPGSRGACARCCTGRGPRRAAMHRRRQSPRRPVENPYGLEALWRQGDFVSKGTLIILVIMSMGSWYIIFVKLWEQFKLMRQGREMARVLEVGLAEGWRQEAARTAAPSATSPKPGSTANEHHEGALTENIDLNTWVTMSVQRAVDTVQSRLQDGLAFLATVGSTAPFVGLFGTVWGIYHALTAIGIAGQASIDKVAGPVGEALIMTAIGLAVAVPAVMGYNWLVRRNKVAMETVRAFGADLHAVLLGRKVELKGAPGALSARSTETQPWR